MDPNPYSPTVSLEPLPRDDRLRVLDVLGIVASGVLAAVYLAAVVASGYACLSPPAGYTTAYLHFHVLEGGTCAIFLVACVLTIRRFKRRQALVWLWLGGSSLLLLLMGSVGIQNSLWPIYRWVTGL